MADSYLHCEQCRTLSIGIARAKDDLGHAARRLARSGPDSPRRGMANVARLKTDVRHAKQMVTENRATLEQHQANCPVALAASNGESWTGGTSG